MCFDIQFLPFTFWYTCNSVHSCVRLTSDNKFNLSRNNICVKRKRLCVLAAGFHYLIPVNSIDFPEAVFDSWQ